MHAYTYIYIYILESHIPYREYCQAKRIVTWQDRHVQAFEVLLVKSMS